MGAESFQSGAFEKPFAAAEQVRSKRSQGSDDFLGDKTAKRSEPQPDVETQLDVETRPDVETQRDVEEQPASATGPEPDRDSVRPGSLSDQPTPDDQFGFTPYVKAVAQFLGDPKTEPPLTMSIEGEWGSGKSSFFMRQLRKELESGEEADKFVTVWFDPWRHDNEDSLWSAFALLFMRDIAEQIGFLRRRIIGPVLLAYKRFDFRSGGWALGRFALKVILALAIIIGLPALAIVLGPTVAAVLVSGDVAISIVQSIIHSSGVLGGLAVLGAAGWRLWRQASPALRAPLAGDLLKHLEAPDYASRIAFVEKFREDFQKILASYYPNQKIVVFIDDVDRCEVPKAADLMQAINLLIADDPQIIFIIGMDRQKVAAEVAAKHEKVLKYIPGFRRIDVKDDENEQRGLEFGYNFIEKFIQVPFTVPTPTVADVEGFLSNLSDGKAAADQALLVSPSRRGSRRPLSWRRRKQPGPVAAPGESVGRKSGDNAFKAPGSASPDSDAETPDIAKEKEQRYLREVRFELEERDSPHIHRIVLLVTPALGHNPRRIKQFLSLFRLRAYIASETGLFLIAEGQDETPRLTLEQLGKFTALSLRWPLLAAEVKRRDGLLGELQNAALDQSTAELGRQAQWWLDHEGLRPLLRSGCFETDRDGREALDADGRPKRVAEDQAQLHSLAEVDVRRLLAVSTPPEPRYLIDEEPRRSIEQSIAVQRAEPENLADEEGATIPGEIRRAIEVADMGDRVADSNSEDYWVTIPAGSFWMGAQDKDESGLNYDPDAHDYESPPHRVSHGAYRIARYPVTAAEYGEFIEAGGYGERSHWETGGFGRWNSPGRWREQRGFPNRPVIRVSWYEAAAYAAWKKARLPTEAEWERAARGTDARRYPWGDSDPDPSLLNYDGKIGRPTPVGVYLRGATPDGMFDLAGNVWEWCWDWFGQYRSESQHNPRGPSNGKSRVLRGGSWGASPLDCRAALRNWPKPDDRTDYVGFRVASGT